MSVKITVNGVDYEVPSSAADTNWAADQVAFEQALAAQVNTNTVDISTNASSVTSLEATVWVNITNGECENDWVNIVSAPLQSQRCKRAWGDVSLRLYLDTGSTNAVCYTLPVGWRPIYPYYFLCPNVVGDGICKVSIAVDGSITLHDITGDATANGLAADIVFSTRG